MKIKLTLEAIEDIALIKRYIREEFGNPIAANRAANNIAKSYKQLKTMPHMGVSLRLKYGIDTPSRVLVSGSYIIFYEVKESEKFVEILNIFHSKQNYIKTLFPDYEYETDVPEDILLYSEPN